MTDEHTGATPEVEVIYSAEVIAARLEELAKDITARNLERPLIVAVLKGSFVFAADLIRALYRSGLEPEVDFLTLSSYRKSRTSSGKVEILRDLDLSVDGRNVLLIDDQGPHCGARRERDPHLRADRQGRVACRQRGRRFQRIPGQRRVRRRLRNGCRAPLPRASVRRPDG